MYSDLIYQASGGNRTQGDAVAKTANDAYVAIARGVAVDYSGYANYYSGKFRSQIYVISGS